MRSRLLAVRAERIAAERSGGGGGCTTDDDVMSELGRVVPGKFCPRSERRQQLERQRQRRAEELIRTKNLSLDAGATAGSAALTAASATASRRSAEPEQHPPAHRQPGPAAALAEAATANSAASPGRNVFTKKGGGGGGMTNSPSCGEFQYSRQPVEALAASARRQQEPIGASSGPVAADTNKRYSYHEESYSHVPNDILVSVMTV